MSKKKDKGKNVLKPEDYCLVPQSGTTQQIQVPTQNKFGALDKFPPLPYKQAVVSPFPYKNKHSEHLFLTNNKVPPLSDVVKPYIHKTFGQDSHFLSDHPQKDRRFYELILVDSQSCDLSHTKDRTNPDSVIFSKCIIKRVINSNDWKNPFQERELSIPYLPQKYNYNDYKMAWYRAFLLKPATHSWFFNFHDKCSHNLPIWFYHWWTLFGGTSSILPDQVVLAWNLWSKDAGLLSFEPYTREVHFFRTFNVAWIFCWEYKLQSFLPSPFPLSMVRIYKVRWWPEFSLVLCGLENVQHFLKHKTKLHTFYSLKQAETKQIEGASSVVPKTPTKKESSASNKSIVGSKKQIILEKEKQRAVDDLLKRARVESKGITQKQRDVFDLIKDDPILKKEFIQQILSSDKSDSEDDDISSTAESSSKPDPYGGPFSQDPFDF